MAYHVLEAMEAVVGHLQKALVVVEGHDQIRKAKEAAEALRKKAEGEVVAPAGR